MEYVDVAWATSSVLPADQMSTSPTANHLPSFSNLASAGRSAAPGLGNEIDAEIGRDGERHPPNRSEDSHIRRRTLCLKGRGITSANVSRAADFPVGSC
jgi:hypothetical protein